MEAQSVRSEVFSDFLAMWASTASQRFKEHSGDLSITFGIHFGAVSGSPIASVPDLGRAHLIRRTTVAQFGTGAMPETASGVFRDAGGSI